MSTKMTRKSCNVVSLFLRDWLYILFNTSYFEIKYNLECENIDGVTLLENKILS